MYQDNDKIAYYVVKIFVKKFLGILQNKRKKQIYERFNLILIKEHETIFSNLLIE